MSRLKSIGAFSSTSHQNKYLSIEGGFTYIRADASLNVLLWLGVKQMEKS